MCTKVHIASTRNNHFNVSFPLAGNPNVESALPDLKQVSVCVVLKFRVYQ